jgi:hypothetical protein
VRVPVMVLVAVALSACGSRLGPFGPTVHIDWVNFIKLDGITYVAAAPFGPGVGRDLRQSDLGAEVARIAFKLDGNVNDPSYRSKDGDAAFLEPGTPVYVLRGYSPSFRLAASLRGGLVLYEADTNARAKKGVDLMDLHGKVAYLGINSERDGITELGAIRDPRLIERLVQLVLEAPVDQDRQDQEGTRYFVAFYLADGTASVRSFSLSSGELRRGIMLPAEFRGALEQAVTPR